MKKLTSLLLCLFMILPLFVFVSNAEETALTVAFDNTLRGSAAGTYTLTAEKGGTYGFYWADAQGEDLRTIVGEKELSYTALFELSFTSAGKKSYTVQSFTAIPYGAEKLVAKQGGKVVASFDIPAEKQQKNDKNYAYGVISDLHYSSFTDSAGADAAIAAVDNAYAFFKAAGVQNVFTTGDYSSNEDEPAYQKFAAANERSGLTVISCGGNHEVVAGADKMFGTNGYFYKYTNKGVFDLSLEGALELSPGGFNFVYQIPGTDDIFLAMSQTRWDSRTTSEKEMMKPEEVVWMGEMLEKYKDKNMHLLMHTYLSDDDHENVDGEGDITNSVGYGYYYHWNVSTEEEAIFRGYFDKYENLIWFNGHSHWAFSMQSYNPNLNIYDYEGTTATCVHVPSVTAPRTVGDTETAYHTNVGKYSEGILMFSCDGYEVLNGIDFKTGKIDAYACYIIYNKSDTVDSGKIGSDTVEWTFDKQLSTLRITGSGTLANLTAPSEQPYAKYADSIRSVYVGKEITEIGKNCFAGLKNLSRVEIKEGTAVIGAEAFGDCPQIGEVYLPESLRSIEENAFKDAGEPHVIFSGTAEKYAEIAVAGGNEAFAPAKVKCQKCIVTWKIGDYVKTESIKIGLTPDYGDAVALPTSAKDVFNPFKGWSNGKITYGATQSLPTVKNNVTYTAVFGDESERYMTGSTSAGLITWTFDNYSGTLTLKGKKDMFDFDSTADRPWDSFADKIYTVVVKSGITKVSKFAFSKLKNLTTIIFEERVTTIGADCFSYCDSLTNVYLPSTVSSFGQGICFSSGAIKNVYYGGSEEKWEKLRAKVTAPYNNAIIDCGNVVFDTPAPTSDEYTVTFVMPDGSVIAEKKAEWNTSVIPPQEVKENSAFIGWDAPYFLVKDNMIVTAIFEDAAQPNDYAALPFNIAEFIITATIL